MSREIVDLTDVTWPLFERLLGPDGLQGGCWCAFFRMTGPGFRAADPGLRQQVVRDAAAEGSPIGLLALDGGEPIGWVAVSPRDDLPRLRRSVIAAPPAGTEVLPGTWAVTCFHVPRARRGGGLTGELLHAATHRAIALGARVVEGYPVEPDGHRTPGDLYHGSLSTFLAEGYELVERRGAARALVRYLPAPTAR